MTPLRPLPAHSDHQGVSPLIGSGNPSCLSITIHLACQSLLARMQEEKRIMVEYGETYSGREIPSLLLSLLTTLVSYLKQL